MAIGIGKSNDDKKYAELKKLSTKCDLWIDILAQKKRELSPSPVNKSIITGRTHICNRLREERMHMGKPATISDNIIKKAAEEGARMVLKALACKKEENLQARKDKRLKNAKFLLKNYRDLKLGAENAISSATELGEEDYAFFERLMGGGSEELTVESIICNKARTAVMMAHVDAMLKVYEDICNGSPRQEDRRRYSVLYRLCMADIEMTATQISEEDHTYEKAVYRDFDSACERMGILLFGIPWFGQE